MFSKKKLQLLAISNLLAGQGFRLAELLSWFEHV